MEYQKQEDASQGQPEKYAKDKESREDYYAQIQSKLREAQSVKERLYQLRYDFSRPESDIIRDVKNLSQELNRIEDDIDYLRKKELKEFENSLNLGAIRLENFLTVKKPKVGFKAESETITLEPNVPDHDTMEFTPENLKLMRTRSTQSMEDKDPKERWQSLFKMFKEWKHQTTVAEAATIAKKSETDMIHDEIYKLRTAIYSLRQRKNLSSTDQALLDSMSHKLQTLTRKSTDLSRQSIQQE